MEDAQVPGVAVDRVNPLPPEAGRGDGADGVEVGGGRGRGGRRCAWLQRVPCDVFPSPGQDEGGRGPFACHATSEGNAAGCQLTLRSVSPCVGGTVWRRIGDTPRAVAPGTSHTAMPPLPDQATARWRPLPTCIGDHATSHTYMSLPAGVGNVYVGCAR